MAKRINSRNKGSRMERKAAELLKKWTSYDFTRVPSSGGLRWKKTDNITGDIVCADERHKCLLSFEIKARATIDFSKLVTPHHNSEIYEFWEQCKNDAERGFKIPLLMFRNNGLSPSNFFFIAMEAKHFRQLYPHMSRNPNYYYIKCFGKHKIVIFHPNLLLDTPYMNIHKVLVKIFKKQWPKRYESLTYGL